MSTVVLTNRMPVSDADGYDLRVCSLSRYAEGPQHLLVVPFDAPDARPPTRSAESAFASFELLPEPFAGAASPRRHLRVSDGSFLRLAYPRAFAAGVAAIRDAIVRRRADRLVVFGSNLGDLARAVGFPHVLLDVCDSVALTAARQYRHDGVRLSACQRARARLHLWRMQRGEAALPDHFNQVTTINAADTAEIVRLHGGRPSNVHTLPNGVGEAFLVPMLDIRRERSIAFWGNLDFAPNREAVRYFIDSIYRPHLRAAGARVRIIGKGAEPWLLDLAAADPQLEVVGFADDLIGAVSRCAVMVNPMRIGSGLKNKVLEAFALGLPVVSTHLGAEAFPSAAHDQHLLLADDPREFAAAVLKLLDDDPTRLRLRASARQLVDETYRWQAVGARWNALLQAC